MDLLLSRYASPFSFIDSLLLTQRFSEWVDEFLKITNEEKDEKSLWDYFMHKVFADDMSFEDFRESVKQDQKNRSMSKQTIETTVTESLNILNNYKPAE